MLAFGLRLARLIAAAEVVLGISLLLFSSRASGAASKADAMRGSFFWIVLGALALAPASARAGPRAARHDELVVCNARIDVEFVGPSPVLPREAFLQWIEISGNAVARYFGRFPVDHYRLRVIVDGDEGGVHSGRTWGYGGAHTDVHIGRQVTKDELARDWVMTHEMVHVAFPNTGDDHPWIQEGVATYVEPLARAFVGTNSIEYVWRDLVTGLPKGMPAPGDKGLDRSSSWGSTYWGGALFYARADVAIRKQTASRLGLIDALRGLLAAGGNNEVEWSAERAFKTADAAVGVKVLEALWAEMGPKPSAPDLALLWKQLGVPRERGAEFDDRAPDAAIRLAIGAAPPAPGCGR